MRKNAASERFDNNDLARRGIHHKEGSAYLAFEHAVAPEPHQPMVLDEHYRCHPHIARWFNRVFYGGSLTVLTDVAPPLTHGVAHRLPGGRRADLLPPRLPPHRRSQPASAPACPSGSPCSEARNVAFANRQRARAGGDPLAEKRHGQGVPTVEEAAAEVLAQQRPGWRNAKYALDWPRSLRAYAFPRIGALPVSAVTTADVLAILTPIWHEKAQTAQRVRQRISAVMKWAIAMGLPPLRGKRFM